MALHEHDDSIEASSDDETWAGVSSSANQSTDDAEDKEVQSTSTAKKTTNAPHFSLYLRFHRRPASASAVQQLDAAITNVRLPRQKNAHHCLVDFRTASDLEAATERLRRVVVDEHALIVKPAHTSAAPQLERKARVLAESREARAVLHRLIGNLERVASTNAKRAVGNGVFVRDLPRDIRKNEVEAAFPDALEVRILVHERADRGAGAAIEMPSPADALRARKARVSIRDVSYRPEFQRDGKHSVKLAKRLASRGVSMGPARYFNLRHRGSGGKVAQESGAGKGDGDGEDEIKEEEDDADVVNEILNVYN